MASEKQVDWIRNLTAKKNVDLTPEIRTYVDAILNTKGYLESLTNQQVDEIVTMLKQLPWLESPATPSAVPQTTSAPQTNGGSLADKVMAGRYFIVDSYDGTEKFVKVDKPEPPSRWAGYTFVNIQASDDFYPVKDKDHREAIFSSILNAPGGPIQAMNEYGIRLEVCGRCGRTLTAKDSRMRGLGPDCAEILMGIPTEAQLDMLRQLGLKKD